MVEIAGAGEFPGSDLVVEAPGCAPPRLGSDIYRWARCLWKPSTACMLCAPEPPDFLPRIAPPDQLIEAVQSVASGQKYVGRMLAQKLAEKRPVRTGRKRHRELFQPGTSGLAHDRGGPIRRSGRGRNLAQRQDSKHLPVSNPLRRQNSPIMPNLRGTPGLKTFRERNASPVVVCPYI